MVATIVVRNAHKAMVAPTEGFCGSVVRLSVLCSRVWQESGFSRQADVFTFISLYTDIIMHFEGDLQI